jgi:hypothetical protein
MPSVTDLVLLVLTVPAVVTLVLARRRRRRQGAPPELVYLDAERARRARRLG